MKTVAVIGANGKTGKVFVEAALRRGWQVRGGVRQLQDHGLPAHKNLDVIECDATKQADVTNLLRGTNVVVSLIGHGPGSPARLQTTAIKHVVAAMKQLSIMRLISLTGTGVRFPGDHIPFYDPPLNIPLKLVMRDMVTDSIAHAEVLKKSDVDWTLLRVLKLTNQPASTFTLTAHGPAKLLVPRHDVSNAIIDCIEHDRFVGQAPIVSRK